MELIEDYTADLTISEPSKVQFVVSAYSNPNTRDYSVVVSAVVLCDGEPVHNLDYRRNFESLEGTSHYCQMIKDSIAFGWWNIGSPTMNTYTDADMAKENLLTRSRFEKRIEECEKWLRKAIERIRARREEVMVANLDPIFYDPAAALNAVILPRGEHRITVPEIHPDED